jgi:4-hydroxy-tetrahydrodipicolinate reductase
MGATLARLVAASNDATLVGATERRPARGERVEGVAVASSLDKALAGGHGQVVVDFTSPEASLAHARTCAKRGVPLVIGTTGFSHGERRALDELASQVPIVLSPNTSVGVNLVVELAGRLAQALGQGYDVEILEAHHRMKKDAPSGTALRLAEEIAQSLGRSPEVFKKSRDGKVGERPGLEIGLQSLRGGDVVGEHTVFFLGDGERVELTHRATSRDTFARGALRAARWVVDQAPGLYTMKDVLGLSASGIPGRGSGV